jgi:tetratricopeptide (TPR) repeat protein
MIFFRAVVIVSVLAGVWGVPQVAFSKEKRPKVSELLKDANDLMSQAQTAYIDGQAKQAIELYRKALAEIERIELENVLQAASSEFAPVRFRKALCETEIDRIMLEEVNSTARTVAVTDTRGLEAKREERKKAAETNNVPEAAVQLSSKRGVEKEGADTSSAKAQSEGKTALPDKMKEGLESNKPVSIEDELEWAKDMISVDRFEDAEKSLMLVLKKTPEHREGRFLMALARVRQGRNADAAVIIDDLLADNPSDQSSLLLAAGCHVAAGAYAKAMETLDKAMKADPKRPDGYQNMAWLLLEMNAKDSSEAEMYYRQAVKLGGARDRDIERRLGIKQN